MAFSRWDGDASCGQVTGLGFGVNHKPLPAPSPETGPPLGFCGKHVRRQHQAASPACLRLVRPRVPEALPAVVLHPAQKDRYTLPGRQGASDTCLKSGALSTPVPQSLVGRRVQYAKLRKEAAPQRRTTSISDCVAQAHCHLGRAPNNTAHPAHSSATIVPARSVFKLTAVFLGGARSSAWLCRRSRGCGGRLATALLWETAAWGTCTHSACSTYCRGRQSCCRCAGVPTLRCRLPRPRLWALSRDFAPPVDPAQLPWRASAYSQRNKH